MHNIEEMTSGMSTIEKELEAHHEATRRLEQGEAEMRLRNELEEQKQKAAALELSMKHMKETREAAAAAHDKKVQEMQRIATELKEKAGQEADIWLPRTIGKTEARNQPLILKQRQKGKLKRRSKRK